MEWRRAKWGKRGSAYYRWAEQHSAQWAHAVIADSHGIVDHLLTNHGVVATYIPYGAPLVTPDPARLLELSVEPQGFHVVVARFEPENHVREIVEGYVSSSCRLPLLVVGDAAYGSAYRNEILRAANGDPRVRFLGGVWDQGLLDALYAGAASYFHGHSVGGTNPSLLRAMGAGAPVIAYDVTFNQEVARANGRYFRQPDDVARECKTVESDVAAALVRGRAGRVDVIERYQWDEVADAYEKLAHELVSASRFPSGRHDGAHAP